MKSTLFVFSFLFLVVAKGQDNNYNGPAKPFVNSFWKMAEMTRPLAEKGISNAASRIDNMDKTIGIIKEKDPAYNTASMIEEVKKLREMLQSKSGAYEKEKEQAKVQKEKEQQENEGKIKLSRVTQTKITELLEFLFGRNNDNLNRAEVKAKTDELLSLDWSGYGNFEVWVKRIRQKAAEAQKRYPKLEIICKEETRAVEAQRWYRIFQSYQSYWDAAQNVFPEEEGFKKTYGLITNVLNGLGTEDNLLTLIAKNYKQKVKDTRLPAAKVKDAALEKLFMDAYNKMYSESFNGRATKAIIVSEDWQIQRSELTGIVTGRLRKGAIVYKNAEGQCRLIDEFFIQQEYVGNSFVGTKSVYAVGKGQEILYENAQ